MQGAGAELAFALVLYRRWTLPVAMLGGGRAGIGAAIPTSSSTTPTPGRDFKLLYAAAAAVERHRHRRDRFVAAPPCARRYRRARRLRSGARAAAGLTPIGLL